MTAITANQSAFAAIAEPTRRRLLDILARGGASGASLSVTELVKKVRRRQPDVSKDLAVLREAGLVSVTKAGRQRLYAVEGQAMRGVYEWVAQYEQFWSHQVDRIQARAEANARRARQQDTNERRSS